MDKNIVNYNNVLIVGNGFDLSLGFKTSYSDFLNSEIFKSITNNTLAEHLKLCLNNSRWIDIEKELYQYSIHLFYKVGDNFHPCIGKERLIKYLRHNYYEICYSLREYLREVTNCSVDLNHKTAYNIISNVCTAKFSTYILTFNYTEIIERIQREYFPSCNNYDINHIHGSLSNDNIVFGIEDSAEIAKEHVFLYKSYNQVQNINGLIRILKGAENITFFGYSLGQTDHSYFDDFFKSQTLPDCKSKKFTFYYYRQDGYDDLIWQLKILTNNRLSYLKQYNQLEFYDVSNP